MKNHRYRFLGDDGFRPRRRAHIRHVAQGFSHAFFLQHLDDRRQTHRADEADDGHDDHDFNQGESAMATRDA